ncbi:MAG TPA: hypothetical protein VLM89_01185 [Phycisphaerae bacterium]|nr:hypothetical protein [Phycisphaerae bacterium]
MTPAPPSPSVGPSRRRRRRLRLRIGILIVMLALATAMGRFAYLRITLTPTPRLEHWEAELAALDPPLPGALAADEARALISNRPWEKHPALTSFSNFNPTDILAGAWTIADPKTAAVEKVFKSPDFNAGRDRMREAVLKEWSIPWPLEPSAPIPVLAEYRAWAQWLTAHSRWARESQGDTSAAVEDWLTTFRMGRQLTRSHSMLPWLVEMAIVGPVSQEMMMASRETLDPLDTASMVRRIDEILGPVPPADRLLAGERIEAQHTVESVYVRQGGDWLVVSEVAKYRNAGLGMILPGNPSRLWNLFSPLYHDIHTARDCVDRCYASLKACTDAAVSYRIDAKFPGTPTITPPNVLAGFPGESLSMIRRFFSMYYDSRTHIEAAAAMLAIREYHRRHGRYPETLELLVPEFLPRLPVDYADRQTLRYRRTNDSYVLYSVGLNGIDDGGHSGSKSAWAWSFVPENPDVVFTEIRRGQR